MAIVSISRIQHRRGLQLDLPQLASAEFGWSLDSQKLYIGNGVLAEGAPRLGNTEILTEHSDILRLAESYTYLNEDAGYTPTTGGRNNRFNAIAYGDGKYVVVGTNGSIITSTDGTTWTPVYGGTTNTLNDICYGLIGAVGYFVAVGASGTIIYSQDGAVWNTSITSTLLTLTSITYAGGAINSFVATSNTGSIIVSADANIWTVVATGVTDSLNAIDYYDGLLVVVGNNGTILTSTAPGLTANWIQQTSPTGYNLIGINWTSDQWIATGDYSTVLVSLDALDWTFGFTDTFRAAATNTGIWVFVGDGGLIYKSSGLNGTDLAMTDSGTTENLFDITFSSVDNTFIAVGANGTILTSSTTALWTSQDSGTIENLNKVIYDSENEVYVVVGTNGTILTSTDGSTWTEQDSNTSENLYGIAIWPDPGTYTYIAVGDNGAIVTTTNLSTTWTVPTTGLVSNLQSVTVADLGGGTYKAIAVGMGGDIVSSSDAGATWGLISNSNEEDLHGVNYITWTYDSVTSSKFFATGNNATILVSDNGTTWDPLNVSTTNHLFNIYYGINRFWVVGSVGYSTLYADDITLSQTVTNQSLNLLFSAVTGFGGPTLTASTYGASKYVLVGKFDSVLASDDGQNFISQTQRNFSIDNLLTADILDISYHDGSFLAVGNKGLLLTSTDSVTWDGRSYVFGNAKTTRSLQHKLDDLVSVKDFGAKGDGLTDDTEAINRALYELYCRSPNPSARKVLHFPGGRYIISDGINVPSNAVLHGEGANNTIIQQTADPTFTSYVMTTADSLQQIGGQLGYNGASMPSDIIVEDMALESKGDGVWLINASRVSFSRVRMTGDVDGATSEGDEWTGIYMIGAAMSTPTDINFLDCYIEKFNYGVFQPDTEFSRNVRFDSTTFFNIYKGMSLCKGAGQVNTMTISNCVFDQIYAQAVDANYVTNVTSTFNSYRDVGNSYNGNGNAGYEIILFDTQSIGCASINDQFDRGEAEAFDYPWVIGNSTTGAWFGGHEFRVGLFGQSGGETHTLSPAQTGTSTDLYYTFDDNTYNQRIQYMIVRGNYTRTGILQLVYNVDSGEYSIDDDSVENGDVGVVFSLSDDGTQVSLDYTSTAGGSDFTLSIAERFVKTAW